MQPNQRCSVLLPNLPEASSCRQGACPLISGIVGDWDRAWRFCIPPPYAWWHPDFLVLLQIMGQASRCNGVPSKNTQVQVCRRSQPCMWQKGQGRSGTPADGGVQVAASRSEGTGDVLRAEAHRHPLQRGVQGGVRVVHNNFVSHYQGPPLQNRSVVNYFHQPPPGHVAQAARASRVTLATALNAQRSKQAARSLL